MEVLTHEFFLLYVILHEATTINTLNCNGEKMIFVNGERRAKIPAPETSFIKTYLSIEEIWG